MLLYRLSIAIKNAELENYEIIILDNNSIKNLKFLKKIY